MLSDFDHHVASLYGAASIPLLIVVDTHGKVRAVTDGYSEDVEIASVQDTRWTRCWLKRNDGRKENPMTKQSMSLICRPHARSRSHRLSLRHRYQATYAAGSARCGEDKATFTIHALQECVIAFGLFMNGAAQRQGHVEISNAVLVQPNKACVVDRRC